MKRYRMRAARMWVGAANYESKFACQDRPLGIEVALLAPILIILILQYRVINR